MKLYYIAQKIQISDFFCVEEEGGCYISPTLMKWEERFVWKRGDQEVI